MKDLLRTADLSATDLALLLDRAAAIRLEPLRGSVLDGDAVILYFEKPSTRTRLSFEIAVAHLHGHPIFTGPGELSIARGETIEDTARVASRFARAWIMRTVRHSALERFARAATIPVVNARTDRHHPCQTLADLSTIRTRFGAVAGRKLAYVGVGGHVAHDLMQAAALAGMHVRLACPQPYGIGREAFVSARGVAQEAGGSVELFDSPRAAVEGADVVHTDVWSSMYDDPDEAAARRSALEPYRVDAALMNYAGSDAVFMHGLPCRRGEEVTADVVDGPRSVIFDQAEARLHVAAAILETLLRSELSGRR